MRATWMLRTLAAAGLAAGLLAAGAGSSDGDHLAAGSGSTDIEAMEVDSISPFTANPDRFRIIR